MPTRRKSRSEEGDSLSTYRAKLAFDRTPEPGGLDPKAAPKPGGLLIVHMHDATRLHWDLRLEMNGVLMSWGSPKVLPQIQPISVSPSASKTTRSSTATSR